MTGQANDRTLVPGGELHDDTGGVAGRFWEGHYRAHERVWSGRPNPVLVDMVGPLPPGTALDLGCGEGGDAIWLAGLGWRVTAVDVSAIALDRASSHAATAGVEARVDFQQHDLTRTFPVGDFDLVSAQYLHSPVEFPRERVLRTAAQAVSLGGFLLIVAHASVPSWSWAEPGTSFPTPHESLAALDLDPKQWRSERLDAPERLATGPSGECATVTDNIIALTRLTR